MIKLRDGSQTADPRLGRIPQFDERSRQFSIRALVSGKPIRSYTWNGAAWLDQGSKGFCVGCAWTNELRARPVMVHDIAEQYAEETIYWEAQKIDPWEGGAYEGAKPFYEGTSVLAGAKVCQTLGHFQEYRWAFGLDDLLLALGYAGPAVLGLNWYRNMAEPTEDGQITPDGQLLGGHAILAYRVEAKRQRVWLRNSWSRSWGVDGSCWLSFEDLDHLLHEQGEACIPIKRARVLS